MKLSIIVLLLAAVFSHVSHGSVVLNQDDTALLSFDLDGPGSGTALSLLNNGQTRVGVHFVGLSASESFELKVYDDSVLQPELFHATYSGGTGNVFYDFSPAIPDLDGLLAIKMTVGSATLDEFFVVITLPDGKGCYSRKYPNPTSIPEPSSTLLASVGVLALQRIQRCKMA